MQFKDFDIGDWLYDSNEELYFSQCIFIKTDENSAYAINWDSCVEDSFFDDSNVQFCSTFFVTESDYKDISADSHKPFALDDNSCIYASKDCDFKEIDYAYIFKAQDGFLYKKLNDSMGLCIKSDDQNRMGRIYFFNNDAKCFKLLSGLLLYPEINNF